MPSCKAKMHEPAKKKDIELGAKSVKSLTRGSYAERVGKALPDIPAELFHFRDLVAPINKKFEPVEKCARVGEGGFRRECRAALRVDFDRGPALRHSVPRERRGLEP